MNKTRIAIAVLLACCAGAASAADGYFTTFDLGQARPDDNNGPGVGNGSSPTSFGLGGGFMFNNYFGLEGGYRRLGKSSLGAAGSVTGTFLGKPLVVTGAWAASTNTDGFYVGPVLNYEFKQGLRVNARAGAYLWTNKATTSGAALQTFNGTAYGAGVVASMKNTGTSEYWGLGGSYRIMPNLDVGLNYDRFKADSRFYDVWGVRLKYSF